MLITTKPIQGHPVGADPLPVSLEAAFVQKDEEKASGRGLSFLKMTVLFNEARPIGSPRRGCAVGFLQRRWSTPMPPPQRPPATKTTDRDR